MIAPIIRVASSYGVTNSISQNDALKRCASYQEDGIPAGRWRVPTKAEVKFISTLSSLGRIPYLFGGMPGNNFNRNFYYWTANGCILVNNGSKTVTDNTNTSAMVRCVYDEWFWGEATTSRPVDYDQFTWGDRNY